MDTVLVLADPVQDGYCHQLADRALYGLQAAGHEVSVLDLHQQGFKAAMSLEEREAYHGAVPICDPLVADHAAQLGDCDMLVFVYPTRWSGLPAILKGWLERVMVPGVAFRFDERSGKVRPALTNVNHVVGISTYGPTRQHVAATNDNGRRVITRALRINCGLRTRTRWHGIYEVEAASDLQRDEFAAHVERDMAEFS